MFEATSLLERRAASAEATRFGAPPDGRLTPEMVTAFEREGYLLLEDLVSADECDGLRARAEALVEDFNPSGLASVFSTRGQVHGRDRYFQDSGDKIRFFFEEDAFDDDGRLRQAKGLSINKIGHAQHDLDPTFAAFSHKPVLNAIATGLGVRQPLLLQSMYIFKQPHIGGEVGWHQDSTFLHTEPLSVIGFWFALEDATVENGCLWALPGGHLEPLRQRWRRAGEKLVMEQLDETPWPEETAVPLEAREGSLVLLHGKLPHGSLPNRSARSRHAYTLHVIDGACHYSEDNWLQRDSSLPLRGFNAEDVQNPT